MRALKAVFCGIGVALMATASACVASGKSDETQDLRPVALNSFAGEAGYVGATSFFQRAPISQHAPLYAEMGEELQGYRLVITKDFQPCLLIGVTQILGAGIEGRDLEIVTTDKNTADAAWTDNSAGHIETRSIVQTVMAPISAESYAQFISSVNIMHLAAVSDMDIRENPDDPPPPCLHPPHVYFEVYVDGEEQIFSRRGCEVGFEEFLAATKPFFDLAFEFVMVPPEQSGYARDLYNSASVKN